MSTTAEKLKQLAQEASSDGFVQDAYSTIKYNLSSMISGDPRIKAQIAEQSMDTASMLRSVASRSDIPAENQIETPGIAFGEGVTDTIPFTIGIGTLAQFIPQARGASGAGKVVTSLQNMLSQYGRVFRQRPVSLATGEAIAGGIGGLTGYTLEREYPDLPAARFIGEMAGGISADLVPKAIKMLPAVQITQAAKKRLSRSEKDVQRRAAELLSIGNREEALKLLSQSRDFSPGAKFTSAIKTEDPIYSRMEQTILKAAQKGELPDQFTNMLEETNKAIRDDLSFGGLDEEGMQSAFERQVRYYKSLLDTRISIAANQSDQAISKLVVTDVKENIEPIVRSKLSEALQEARQFEDSLFKAIDQSEIVNINISKIAQKELFNSLPTASKADMPDAAAFLDPKSPKYIGKKTVKGKAEVTNQNSIFELRGVQSELRREARAARAGDNPNFNKARIADELADSITEDIANIYVEPGSENPVAVAVAFSRELNNRFGKGSIAKVLRRDRRGGDSIDPSMTLSATLGTDRTLNRVAYDDILTAVSGNPEVQSAMEDFIKFKFFRGSEFNPRQAQEFLNSNADLMNRMPAFKSEIQDAIRTNNAESIQRSRKADGTVFLNPDINKAIIYMNKNASKAFNEVIASNSPSKNMRNLMRMTKLDETGEAFQGLKTGFAQFLFDKASKTVRVPTGGQMKLVDGNLFNELVQDKKVKQTIMTLFSKEERARIERAARTAQMLAKQVQTRPSIELVQQQNMNMLQRALLRISGGSIGRSLGTGTLQAPEQMANIFENLARGGVLDAEKKMLEDAMFNDDLFKAMLETPTKAELSKKSQTAIRAWAAQTLATYGDEQQEQEN